MDPNLNVTPPPSQPPVRPKVSRKVLLIVGGVILVIVAVVAMLLLTKKPASKSDTTDTKSSLYVTREGYEYHSGIGDALAIQFKSVATPVEYQGVKVIQACNVLPLDELRGLGLKTEKMQMTTGFERTYFDGQGKGVLRPAYSIVDGPDSNSCRYQLEEGSATISLIVAQEPYVPVDVLTSEVAKYTKLTPIAEQNIYEKKGDIGKEYVIGRGSTGVNLRMTGTFSPENEKKVIDKIAATLAAERANPTGPPEVALESSLIKNGYADACKLLGADSVKSLFNSEVSPIVTQRYGNSVGVLTFESGVSDNYVQNDCIRQIVKTEADINTFSTRMAMLETQTFMREEAGKAEMASTREFNKTFTDVTGVGDDAFFSKDNYGEKLYVRKGRFTMSFYIENNAARLSQDQKIQTLSTLAKSALEKLQ